MGPRTGEVIHHHEFIPDELQRIKDRMRTSVPPGFIPDLREDDDDFWRVIHPDVMVMPLKVQSRVWNEDPKGVANLKKLRDEHGMGKDSFPVMMFFAKRTKDFRIKLFMVEPNDLWKTPEELIIHMGWVGETMNEDVAGAYIRDLQFLYAAEMGAFPEGADVEAPLRELPPPFTFS